MFPYLLVSTISIFFAYLYHISDKQKNKRLSNFVLFISFFTLFIFSALRYDVYNDYLYTYVPGYYDIINGIDTHFELLFVLINKFVYYIFNNVDWLFIITSYIYIFFIGKTLKEKSLNIPFSIFLMLGGRMYFYSFEQIRQYIAIAIFLYNLKNIEQHKWKNYLILTIIGGLIHKLSFIFLPIYFVNHLNLDKKKYIIIMLVVIVFSPIYIKIFTNVARYFYGDYFNYMSLIKGERINNSFVVTLLAVINIILSLIYFDKVSLDSYYKNILYIQIVLLFILLGTYNLFDSYRIVSMFLYTSILLIPKIINTEKRRLVKVVLLIVIIGIYALSGYTFLKNVSSSHPYRTIFEK